MLIGFTSVGTNNLQRAMAFYDALFACAGISRLLEIPGMASWGTNWESPIFTVAVPADGNPAVPGNGNVVGLGFRTRAQVHALHAKALELGGSGEGIPTVRGPDTCQAFYAAYVRDLDGNRLCFFCVGPGGDELDERRAGKEATP